MILNDRETQLMPISKIEIKHYDSAELATTGAVEELRSVLKEATGKGQKVLLLLSGGGNLPVAEQLKDLINNPLVTIYVLDERFSRDSKLNNSLQLREKGLWVRLTVPTETESLEDFAARFNGEIATWLRDPANAGALVVCTLGMGDDGHIAGISPMPGEPDRFAQTFINTDQNVVGYVGNLMPAERVTVAPDFILKKINVILGLITGTKKQPAWDKLGLGESRASDVDIADLPARMLKQTKGRVVVSTDLT